jgi:hypothetical protein
MYYFSKIRIFILKVLLIIIPSLFNVAYVAVAERKMMASILRRLGLNGEGFFVLYQAVALASNIFSTFLKKFVLISLFNEYINIYIDHFLVNFKKHCLNHSLTKSLDFSIDSLILKVYDEVRKINPLIFFILGYCIYKLLGDRDLILLYLSYFLYLIGIFIQLIVIVKI